MFPKPDLLCFFFKVLIERTVSPPSSSTRHYIIFVLLLELPSALTLAAVTVSELQVRRWQGWARAGRPDWVRWRLTGLAAVNPGLTGRERRKQSGVPLQCIYTHTHIHQWFDHNTAASTVVVMKVSERVSPTVPRLGCVVCRWKNTQRNMVIELELLILL